MVIHKFFSSANEVDEFLNSKHIEVIAITKSAWGDSYTIFYKDE